MPAMAPPVQRVVLNMLAVKSLHFISFNPGVCEI